MPVSRPRASTSAASFYEGIRIGRIEIGKTSMDLPQGTATIKAVKYHAGELAVEGVDAPSPQGPVKMERFALNRSAWQT
jgi:hypothetical protein